MAYVHYEFVDEVETLTLAEGPGEAGLIVHFLRATWEDEDEEHEVVNGDGDNVDGAIRSWRLVDSQLVVELYDDAARQLHLDRRLELDLSQSTMPMDDVRSHLADILVDVPES